MKNTQLLFPMVAWAEEDEKEWATRTWKDYRIRWNGKMVSIIPNVIDPTGIASLVPVRKGEAITSFKLKLENRWFLMSEQERLLISDYLLNHRCVIENIPFEHLVWEVVDTRQLNRNTKLAFLLEEGE